MICEACHGEGVIHFDPPQKVILQDGTVGAATWKMCHVCKGARIISCCEGPERDAGVVGLPEHRPCPIAVWHDFSHVAPHLRAAADAEGL